MTVALTFDNVYLPRQVGWDGAIGVQKFSKMRSLLNLPCEMT